MLDFAFRFIFLCKVEQHFAFKFYAIQFYAAIQHDGWHFILKNIWSEPAVRQTAWRWRSYRKGNLPSEIWANTTGNKLILLACLHAGLAV